MAANRRLTPARRRVRSLGGRRAKSPVDRDAGPTPADERRPITIRLPNETLADLQFVSAAIRRSTGAALGASAIVRGLISWLAETDVDTRRVRTPDELRAALLSSVGAPMRAAPVERPRGPVSLPDHSASLVQDDGRRRALAAPKAAFRDPVRESRSPRG
jgi:hypothetical protein